MFCLQVEGPIVGKGAGGEGGGGGGPGVVITGSSRLITDRQQQLTIERLSNSDGDGYGYGYENVSYKVCSRCFKLYRAFSISFSWSNVRELF